MRKRQVHHHQNTYPRSSRGPLRLDTVGEESSSLATGPVKQRQVYGRQFLDDDLSSSADKDLIVQDDEANPDEDTTLPSNANSEEDVDDFGISKAFTPSAAPRIPPSSRISPTLLQSIILPSQSVIRQTLFRTITRGFTPLVFAPSPTPTRPSIAKETSSELAEEEPTSTSRRPAPTSERRTVGNGIAPTTMVLQELPTSDVVSPFTLMPSQEVVANDDPATSVFTSSTRTRATRTGIGGITKSTGGSTAERQQNSRSAPRVSATVVAAVVIGTFIALILSWLAVRHQVKKRQEEDERDQDVYTTRGKMKQRFGISEKDDVMNSGPSWVSGGFTNNLAVPDPPSFDGRYSKRGSGWMVLSGNYGPASTRGNVNGSGAVRQPPGAHLVTRKSPNECDGESRSSRSSEDAVITTASRISAFNGNAASTSPASFKDSGHHGSRERPALAVINKSPSGLSTTSNSTNPSYHQDVYRYDSDCQTNIRKVNVLGGKEAPSNTMIGAASAARGILKGNDWDTDARTRGAMDGFKEGLSTKMARARQPLNIVPKGAKTNGASGYAISTPRRAYHISTSFENEEDEDPFIHDLPSESSKYSLGKEGDFSDQGYENKCRNTRELVRAAGLSTPTITQPSSPVSAYPDSPGRESRSFGKVMVTDYGSDGAILPSFMETPRMGRDDTRDITHDESDSSKYAGLSSEWRLLTPSQPLRQDSSGQASSISQSTGRSITPRFIPTAPTPTSSVPSHPNFHNTTTTPRLTVTSPSNGQIQRLSFSQSSSAEGAFMPLSQMALANLHPDYRSPTYSVYNMYDGDDEGSGMPRKSFVGLKTK